MTPDQLYAYLLSFGWTIEQIKYATPYQIRNLYLEAIKLKQKMLI